MTDEPLKIAIVSDLHVGDNAREFDIQPNGEAPYDGHPGYLNHFKKVVEEQSLTADMLVVSGDITDKAQPSQFRHAAKVIGSLASSLSVPNEQIVIVPGNHDMNWDIAKLAEDRREPFWLDYKFEPFRLGGKDIGCSDELVGSLLRPPHFSFHPNERADVWCFNSAAYDVPDQTPHRGEIREVHRGELEDSLKSHYGSSAKERYRIFVTHHHPKPQPELYPDIPDFSGMVNGESLLDLLGDYEFDLVLHGHKHRPWCRTSLETGKHPIVMWCSGSFSQTLGPSYYGSLGNLWHMLEIAGQNSSDHCYGVVRSWAFAPAQGWVASRPAHHGIDHISPFGYLADSKTIIEHMKSIIETELAAKESVLWESLRQLDPLLEFQPGQVVWKCLDSLGPQLAVRAHGERDSLDDLLILKEESA